MRRAEGAWHACKSSNGEEIKGKRQQKHSFGQGQKEDSGGMQAQASTGCGEVLPTRAAVCTTHAAAFAACPTLARNLRREGCSSAGRLIGVHTGTPTNSRRACAECRRQGSAVKLGPPPQQHH